MNKEQQIDKIYDIISEYDDCEYMGMATAVYNAGYRKMDEVTLKLDLGDRTPEEIKQIAEMFNGEIKKQVAREILSELKFLYKERAREYTNWDTNKVQAVTLDWLNADLSEFAEEYGVEITDNDR